MEDKITISDTDSTPSTSHSSHLSSECQNDYDSPVALEYYSLEVSHIEMHHIPKVGWISLDDRFWLQIIADGKMKETSVAGRGSLCWPDKFTFNVCKSSKLSFRLYARRYIHENKFIGEVGKCVNNLKLVTCPDDVVLRDWYNPEHNDDLEHTTLMCGITKRVLSSEEAAAEAAATQQLRISNIIVHHLPRVKLISLDDHFFVQIEVDDKIACITDVQRGHSLQWRNVYLCDYRKDSQVQLKVFAHRHVHKDHLVCVISDNVESLLRDGSVRRHLSGFNQSGKEHEIPASMDFQITPTIIGSLRHPDDILPPVQHGGVAGAIAPAITSVEISDIRLVHLPKIGMVAFNDQFFVQLGVDSETQTTSQKAQKNGSISWDEKYVFRVPETAVLSLEVYARRPNDEYLGMIRNHISAFPRGSECFDEQLVVFDKESRKNLKTRLSFRIRQSSSSYERSEGPMRLLPTQSKDGSPPQRDTPVTVGAGSSTAPSRVGQLQAGTQPNSLQAEQTFLGDIADTLKPLLSRIDIFVQIGRAFAEAHPYTKMAFMVLTAGYEVIRRQHARDESIRQLASTMCDSYSLVSDATDLCRFQGQQETITLLARQTIECAYFIRDYALHKSGSKHAISNVFSNIDATTLGYVTAFGNIKAALEQKVVINTQLVVFHIHDALKDLAAKVDLNALPYATGASYHSQRSYDGTSVKEDLLTDISNWVNDQNSSTIYLLIGPRGSEASAAAHVVARRFDAISRLGSSYFLARNCQTQQRPTNLFSTIARDLADHDPEFMTCLSHKVKRRALGSSPHIPTQFDFILAPAQQLTSFSPVLIVIDALDACGDANSRVDVLSVLKDRAQNLPPSFKFLITCLSDTDVDSALRDSAHVRHKKLDSVVTEQLRDQRFTVAVGRTNPRPPTPPIMTVFPQPDYFPLPQSASSISNESCSSSISVAPSIFDEELRTFSPDSNISSPASSITPFADAESPKRFLAKVQHIETQADSYSLDPDGQRNTVTHTYLRQTIKQHATSTPRRAPSLTPMLDEPNSYLFTADPSIPAEDTLSVVSQVGSLRVQKKRIPIRQETLIRSEMHTTGSQLIAHLPS